MKRIIVLIVPIVILAFSGRETKLLSFLDDLPLKELPYTEATTFTTSRNQLKPTLSKSQTELLGLRKLFAGRELIYSDKYLAFADSVSMRYRLNLSDNFKTVVLTCHDWRLYTILINYKNEFDVIDFEVIAFDFVDERTFKISSIINKDRLEISHIKDYEESKTIYKIEADGMINTIP